jgi:hypothetical protein
MDYSKPYINLRTENEFTAFYKFHIDVCTLWNGIIDEVMKNDCVDPANPCPDRVNYIKKLQADYNSTNTPICFINCDIVWDASSSLVDLMAGVPENIDCYRGTLTYVVSKSANIIQQVNDAMSQIPQAFVDYKATINCTPDGTGTAKCTDANGIVYISQATQAAKEKRANEQNSDAAKKQQEDTNAIITRCRRMNAEIPALKRLLEQANQNVEQLKVIQKKAKSGKLLPEPAKVPPT